MSDFIRSWLPVVIVVGLYFLGRHYGYFGYQSSTYIIQEAHDVLSGSASTSSTK